MILHAASHAVQHLPHAVPVLLGWAALIPVALDMLKGMGGGGGAAPAGGGGPPAAGGSFNLSSIAKMLMPGGGGASGMPGGGGGLSADQAMMIQNIVNQALAARGVTGVQAGAPGYGAGQCTPGFIWSQTYGICWDPNTFANETAAFQHMQQVSQQPAGYRAPVRTRAGVRGGTARGARVRGGSRSSRGGQHGIYGLGAVDLDPLDNAIGDAESSSRRWWTLGAILAGIGAIVAGAAIGLKRSSRGRYALRGHGASGEADSGRVFTISDAPRKKTKKRYAA
jgi:hypothetical protein